MPELIAAHMNALDIAGHAAYDKTTGWALKRDVETWLVVLRKFQALATKAYPVIQSGSGPLRDATSAQFERMIAQIDDAMPTITFDVDLRAAIERAAADARAAGEHALSQRLRELYDEVEKVEEWLVERLDSLAGVSVTDRAAE